MSQRLCGEQFKTPAFSSDLSRVSNKLMLLNSDQKTPGLDISTTYLRLQAYAEKSPTISIDQRVQLRDNLTYKLTAVTSWSICGQSCYRIGQLDPRQSPSLGRDGGSFSNRIRLANNKTDAETGTARALFNGQKNGEAGTLFTNHSFSTQFRRRHQIYRRIAVKGKGVCGGYS